MFITYNIRKAPFIKKRLSLSILETDDEASGSRSFLNRGGYMARVKKSSNFALEPESG
jgi:hypothetical protein